MNASGSLRIYRRTSAAPRTGRSSSPARLSSPLGDRSKPNDTEQSCKQKSTQNIGENEAKRKKEIEEFRQGQPAIVAQEMHGREQENPSNGKRAKTPTWNEDDVEPRLQQGIATAFFLTTLGAQRRGYSSLEPHTAQHRETRRDKEIPSRHADGEGEP